MRSLSLMMLSLSILIIGLSSCSPKQYPPQSPTGIHPRELNGFSTLTPQLKSDNELDYIIDEKPMTYIIDISTEEGRTKLRNLSIQEAYDLALVEAIMKYKCASIFHPQYTHLEKNGQVLRVTLYGFPAHFKKK